MSYQENPRQDAQHAVSSGEEALLRLASQPDLWALFLDIDGTLIDLADTPDGIVVPAGLPDNLHRLSMRLGGALALVTGRALPYADDLFMPYRFSIAGLHGAERRDPSGAVSRIEPDAAFADMKAALVREAEQWPGVLVEDKGAAVAAHYRQAPGRREAVEAAMPRYLAMAGPDFTLQHGKMVVEIRPARASKGHALEAFLDQPPFRGRKPVAIGDDVTDEAMFRMANRLGGHSIRIAETPAETEAKSTLPSTAALRAVIAALGRAGNPTVA
ncbi:trehalose-phosphatase [Rhizobium puerariae]|uniref:Trehalose 6-phosphate phosphatase n=1 Tax=Rhizobium puerariae TaxID=1585791 RepID=A0ABV6AKM0_9HYPH